MVWMVSSIMSDRVLNRHPFAGRPQLALDGARGAAEQVRRDWKRLGVRCASTTGVALARGLEGPEGVFAKGLGIFHAALEAGRGQTG